jgi:hypothetical protein
MSTSRLGLPALLLAAMLVSACHSRGGAGARLLFRMEDPRGDDHGDGELVYPLRPDMSRGDLDVVSVEAFAAGDATRFEVTFARPIVKPSRARSVDITGATVADLARHGFYMFNVDVYVDLDRVPGSGRTDTLPGRGLVLAPTSAWDRALVLTPRPYEAREQLRGRWREQALAAHRQVHGPVTGMQERELVAAADRELDARVFFATRIQVSGRTVSFEVPDAVFQGQQARPDWGYAVAVTGATLSRKLGLGSLFGLATPEDPGLMVMGLSPGVTQERFGGGRTGDVGQSPVVDLLLPEGITQAEVLGPSRPPWPAVVPAGTTVEPTAGTPPPGAPAGGSEAAPSSGPDAAPAEAPAGGLLDAPDAGGAGGQLGPPGAGAS